MSFHNGLYVFSEVPGYDASKGERIVGAFRKLWAKIKHLEQVRIDEKKAHSLDMQAGGDPGLTITDIQYEILLTQLRFMTKIVKEYAAVKHPDTKGERISLRGQDSGMTSLSADCKVNLESNNNKPSDNNGSTPLCEDNPEVFFNVENRLAKNATNEIADCTDDPTVNETKTRFAAAKNTFHGHAKLPSQSHYHLKLNDVPFILGASCSASHSVVANVQNIIALMKTHNKALCAPRFHGHHDAALPTCSRNRSDTKAPDEMIQELSEDLSKLTQKHRNMESMFDKAENGQFASATKYVTVKDTSNLETTKSKNPVLTGSNGMKRSTSCSAIPSRISKRTFHKKTKGKSEPPERYSVPVARIQSNSHSQLARRKMMRSLQDFKTHLSEEDISWN